MTSPESKVVIIGAGVFGLSTALWLGRSGYKNITVFDRGAFHENYYDPLNGCDGASADINKVFRTAYGAQKEYQELAIEARDIFLEWNKAISSSPASDLPGGLTPEDEVLNLCGQWFLAHGSEMPAFFKESLASLEKYAPDVRARQFVKGKAEDEAGLRRIDPKWVKKFHAIDGVAGGNTNGFMDVDGGINLADKACVYARFLCEKAGVKFILGQPQGKVERLIIKKEGHLKRVSGIATCDGLTHHADIIIVAAGPWTATLLPEAHQTVQATAGTLMFIDVPKDRPDLWEKFSARNYPVWSYRRGEGDEYYQGGGFPITREGRLKFGFRGRKFTNYQDHPTEPNLRISTPRTRYTEESISTVPLYGLKLMKEVIGQAFPELAEIGFTDSRLCWYTDVAGDQDGMVIDYVPGYSDSLFLCTGHGFKFLPNLGRHVKNQLERVPDQFTDLWKWRVAEEGNDSNGILEDEDGRRDISKFPMAEARDFKFDLANRGQPRL